MRTGTCQIQELLQFLEFASAVDGTTPVNGSNIDRSGVDAGSRFVAIANIATPAAGNTLKWEQSADGSTGWEDIPGTETAGATAETHVSNVTSATLRFIRPVITRGTTTVVAALVVGAYLKHDLPTQQSLTAWASGGA